jgi:NAD(P)-dependent dehydrogenase (short-subunit alcohol dehydrogenase family)
MSQGPLFVVIGSGPGIGVVTAQRFAKEGFNIALLSRNQERLNDDASKVKAAGKDGIQVKTFVADASDHVGLQKALDNVSQTMGPPEVVLFNVAQISPKTIGDTDIEYMIQDFKVRTIAT